MSIRRARARGRAKVLGDRLRRSPPPDPTPIWPGLTEARGALPRPPQPGVGPSPPRWAPGAHRGGEGPQGPTHPWEGPWPPAMSSPGAGKGKNLRLLQSLGQNGRHLAPARETRRALRTNQLKQIGQWAPRRAGSR